MYQEIYSTDTYSPLLLWSLQACVLSELKDLGLRGPSHFLLCLRVTGELTALPPLQKGIFS
jgi:hypothetical protein